MRDARLRNDDTERLMPDAADKVVEDEARAMELLERQRLEREARIAESMRSFDPSLPQWCNDCAEQIDPDRLMAHPRASRCTACAEIYEKNMRERYPR
jgi:RNA polymerase-binding transcription factor DksA